MALSGYIPSIEGAPYGGYNGYVYYIQWTATQSQANNSSTITAKWIMKKVSSSDQSFNNTGNSTVTLNIGGVSSTTNVSFDMRNSSVGTIKVLKTYTRTISHNDVGKLSVAISGNHVTGISWGTKSTSGTAVLNDIPRASIPTVTGTLQLGSTITINTNRASTSFTHTIRYGWGSSSGTIASNVTTSKTWLIPNSLATGIPNGTSGTLRIYCDTYNGSTLVGTRYIDKTVTVPNTATFNPSITACTLSEAVEGLNTQFQGFIQTQSKINGTVTASGVYNSTIKSYEITINGATYNTQTFTTDLLLTSGSNNCVVKVTDSRGRSATQTFTYNVLEYAVPTITSFKVSRCDTDGTLNDEGASVKALVNATISSVNNKNTKSFKILYKKQSEETWTTVTLSDTSYTFNNSQIINNIDVDNEYDFKLEVTDYFGTVDKTVEVATAFTLLDFNASGKAMAIGKVSSKENGLEINMPIFDRFDTQIMNGLANYETGGATDPNTTIDELILTNHQNNPSGTARAYFFIRTMFFLTKSQTATRRQVAYPYTGTNGVYTRYYSEDMGWSDWRLISSNVNITTGGAAVPTGRVIDGKLEYVKRINFGNLPNATSKRVATGLTLANITITDVKAMPRQANGDVNVLPFPHPSTVTSNIAIYLRATDNTIVVDSGTYDRSAFSMKVDIYYINN